MNKIFVAGDTHGGEANDLFKLNSKSFPDGNELTKEDYVIIAGDFGLVWSLNRSNEKESYWLNWLHEKPWTTLFVDGNHENHDRLEQLELVEMFGSKVGKVNDSVFHLKRGEIYTINGLDILTFGGGKSIDKERRKEFISWWRQEEPNESEYFNCLQSIKKFDYKVDAVITHDCSARIHALFDFPRHEETTQQQKFFDNLEKDLDYKKWYFGHYHDDIKFDDKHTLLYDVIQELTKEVVK